MGSVVEWFEIRDVRARVYHVAGEGWFTCLAGNGGMKLVESDPQKLVGLDSLHDFQLTALTRLVACELGWPQPSEIEIERPAA
jgi:hypothetical protein